MTCGVIQMSDNSYPWPKSARTWITRNQDYSYSFFISQELKHAEINQTHQHKYVKVVWALGPIVTMELILSCANQSYVTGLLDEQEIHPNLGQGPL